MKDEIKFKEFMTVLCELFDKQLSPLLAQIYWKALEPYPDSQCKKAFEIAIQTAKFFPKPADLLEVVRGRLENRSTHAWIQVDEQVRRLGPYESVKFADSVIHSVIQVMGGWPKFMDCTMGEWKWKQKEFEKLYAAISEREGKHPDHLAGIHELESKGYQGAIHMIGFEDRKQITQ